MSQKSNQLLRYKISSWKELPQCMSNNSRKLHLHVLDVVDTELKGTLIRLDHDLYGTIFACMVHTSGPMLSTYNYYDVHEFTTEEILKELEKYGFIISYEEDENLDGDQLQYLMTLDQLGFDKIRILNVISRGIGEEKVKKPLVVVFKISDNTKWLDNTYQCPEKEFQTSIMAGTALNITAISNSKKFKWGFLHDYVLNISDILMQNVAV